MIALRLRNLDLALAHHGGTEFDAPLDATLLPTTLAPDVEASCAEPGADASGPPSDSDGAPGLPPPLSPALHDQDLPAEAEEAPAPSRGAFPPMEFPRCGVLPPSATLASVHAPPIGSGSRSVEARYARGYNEAHGVAFTHSSTEDPRLAPADEQCLHIPAGEAVAAAAQQARFFKDLDNYRVDAEQPVPSHAAAPSASSSAVTPQSTSRLARQVLKDFPAEPASDMIVLRAAFALLQSGCLNIPDVGSVNLKQARAFLWWSAWLQFRMQQRWCEDSLVPAPEEASSALFEDFSLAIIGPGGTGKTTVLLLVEALVEHFGGSGSVHKCAISNTASRLIGGDTLHALCKLPRLDLQQRQGKLSAPALRTLRAKWRSTLAFFVDEISMVAPEQLLQVDVRVRQATRVNRFLGGIATGFLGDFLQLPPVETHSLAEVLDNVGHWLPTTLPSPAEAASADTALPPPASPAKRSRRTSAGAAVSPQPRDPGSLEDDEVPRQKASAEARQGIDLWRSVTKVVMLSVPMRAPGILSRFLGEMRAGKISTEMWDMYLARVIRPDDPRLRSPPFSTSPVNFIVHRHSIRNMQSFRNARDASRAFGVRLYMVTACDDVKPADVAFFTHAAREEMLRRVNPRATQRLPSHLPLYIGMRLLMFSKDCVRFGLMNGCECELVGIVFADHEHLPEDALAGEYISLEYMPASILLRVPGAAWVLPACDLPAVDPGISRRGLFQLRPSTAYLRLHVEKDTYVSVRRTQFPVLPADTRIVYGAQGETFDAVVVDMVRPPRQDKATHWLACYVMLSRARSIDGLLVLRPATFDELSSSPPPYLSAEMDRLAQLENASTDALWAYLQSLPLDLPPEVRALFHDAAAGEEAARVLAARAASQSAPTTARGAPLSASSSSAPAKRRRLQGKQSIDDLPFAALCERCGRAGCSPLLPTCPFFGRAREAHADAAPGDNVPHMFQRRVRRAHSGAAHDVEVDGEAFVLGAATGLANNCLLDTLRQSLDSHIFPSGDAGNAHPSSPTDLNVLREHLRERFTAGPARVEEANFLTLDYHGLVALDLLLEYGHGRAPNASAAYTIVCVGMSNVGHGDVVGTGPTELHIARIHGNHFVPLHHV